MDPRFGLLMFVWCPGALSLSMSLRWKFNSIGAMHLKLTFRHRPGQALVFMLLDKAFEFLYVLFQNSRG